MLSKKIICLLFCMGLCTEALANPTLKTTETGRLEFEDYVQPKKSVDFKLLVNPAKTIFKIDDKVQYYGKWDYLEFAPPKDSSITLTNPRLKNKDIADITLRDGETFKMYRGDLPKTFLLRGTLHGDGCTPEANYPVVPAPGAVVLGSCGLLIVSWFRKIIR